MTIKELVELLARYPEESEVLINSETYNAGATATAVESVEYEERLPPKTGDGEQPLRTSICVLRAMTRQL